MTQTKSNSFEGKTDVQLQELKAALDSACDYCLTQQGQFWGKGQEEAAGMFQKNSEDFAAKSQEIQDELDRRAKEAAKPKKVDQQVEEQPVSTLPPDIDPAGQPTPATQPVELSTAQQAEQDKGSKSTSSSSSQAKE